MEEATPAEHRVAKTVGTYPIRGMSGPECASRLLIHCYLGSVANLVARLASTTQFQKLRAPAKETDKGQR